MNVLFKLCCRFSAMVKTCMVTFQLLASVGILWIANVGVSAKFEYNSSKKNDVHLHRSVSPGDRIVLPSFFFPMNRPGESADSDPTPHALPQNPEAGNPQQLAYSKMPSLLDAVYIFCAVCFILCLRGLSTPDTAKRGNILGIVGIAAAVLVTFTQQGFGGHYVAFLTSVTPAVILGLYIAHYVNMVQMPQLVALFHSFVGLAAMLVALSNFHSSSHKDTELTAHMVETFVGIFIAAVTFSGSLVAAAKLHELIDGRPTKVVGRHWINGAIVLTIALLGCFFLLSDDFSVRCYSIYTSAALSLLLGFHLVSSIGGADMPVVISMLNSYSGFATAASGFMLDSSLLIISGSLIGSSGAILSYIMCRGMNRSLMNVVLGDWNESESQGTEEIEGIIRETSADSVAEEMLNAKRIIIVPGFGMAVSRCQSEICEIAKILFANGKTVQFAIHPVAGRMPGHMNVLLAEADVPYSMVKEMDEVNPDMPTCDLALVLGANDTVNPASLNPQSKIAGMPVIQVWHAKRVVVCKRSMAKGYAAIENPLFSMENTRMLFGDAKSTTSDIFSRLNQRITVMGWKDAAANKPAEVCVPLFYEEETGTYPPSFKTIGVLKDINGGAEMVALVPRFVPKLRKLGYRVVVEAGAGVNAGIEDEFFKTKGADILPTAKNVIMESQVLLKVSAPSNELVDKLEPRKILISYVWPSRNPELLEKMANSGITSFALDEVPRATRAQKLDVRSSMSNLQGYRAVIEAFNKLPRFSKVSVTAAGKVDAAKVFVIGAGVAGLQAIATAHGLGAQVFANDTRKATREEVESCGGRFLEVPILEDGELSSGYAAVMSETYQAAQHQLYKETVKNVDVVICTAAIPGKTSPKLISEEMVLSMRPGSVILDLATQNGDHAVGWGGNCQLSPVDDVVVKNGVTIIGRSCIERHMPTQASELFSMNICNLLEELGGGENFQVNLDDDIIASMCVVRDGKVLWTADSYKIIPKSREPSSRDDTSVAAVPKSKRSILQEIEQSDFFFALCLFAVAATVGLLGTVMDTLELHHLFLFVLSLVVGYYCVWSVTPVLHTPLMSVTNALSGVIIVGSMVEFDGSLLKVPVVLALVANFLASLNISGGFYVTRRMLGMFVA